MNTPNIVIPLETSSGDYEVYTFQPNEMSWPDIRALWKKHTISYPICFTPPEDRVEMFFFYACQKYETPCSLGTVYNPSWTDMFLSKVNHDCLVIASPLIPYILSNDLFANHIPNIKLLISIGQVNQETHNKLRQRFPDLTCETLRHPIIQFKV